jgi:hypothetical protein
MNTMKSILGSIFFYTLLAQPVLAGIELPVDTIKEMADANKINGICSLNQIEIADSQGAKSLNLTLKIGSDSFPSSITTNRGLTEWSEAKGINEDREPFWRFTLRNADSSKPGAITSMNWNVQGSELRTQSLEIQYTDPATLDVKSVRCM